MDFVWLTSYQEPLIWLYNLVPSFVLPYGATQINRILTKYKASSCTWFTCSWQVQHADITSHYFCVSLTAAMSTLSEGFGLCTFELQNLLLFFTASHYYQKIMPKYTNNKKKKKTFHLLLLEKEESKWVGRRGAGSVLLLLGTSITSANGRFATKDWSLGHS